MKVHGLEFEESDIKQGHSRLTPQRHSELSSTVARRGSESVSEPKPKKKMKIKTTNIILIIIIVILAGALGWVLLKPELPSWFSGADLLSPTSNKKETKKSKYQAVFLTNGQVYFGQLSGFPGKSPILEDVYYLRAQRSLQPTSTIEEEKDIEVEKEKAKEKEEELKQIESQPEVTLVKLGNELHGPVDQIKLNSDHILFVEDLKETSRIVRAILQFKGQ